MLVEACSPAGRAGVLIAATKLNPVTAGTGIWANDTQCSGSIVNSNCHFAPASMRTSPGVSPGVGGRSCPVHG